MDNDNSTLLLLRFGRHLWVFALKPIAPADHNASPEESRYNCMRAIVYSGPAAAAASFGQQAAAGLRITGINFHLPLPLTTQHPSRQPASERAKLLSASSEYPADRPARQSALSLGLLGNFGWRVFCARSRVCFCCCCYSWRSCLRPNPDKQQQPSRVDRTARLVI